MGDLINFNLKPRFIKFGDRRKRMEKQTQEIHDEFEKLKNKRKERSQKNIKRRILYVHYIRFYF